MTTWLPALSARWLLRLSGRWILPFNPDWSPSRAPSEARAGSAPNAGKSAARACHHGP